MNRASALALLLLTAGLLAFPDARGEPAGLLRDPAVSADHLVFVHAGSLWLAGRDGSNPQRLTSSPAEEANPRFSPDGRQIAFSAGYGGNTDVYVIDVDGGQPRRLTWHPGDDIPTGWSADGESVAFASRRETDHGRSAQLYHVPAAGGAPEKVMEARYFRGQWHAEGRRLAYIDFGPAYNGLYGGSAGWKGYRGGTTPSIRILDIDDQAVQSIPGDRVNDIEPFWLGESVYFLSDRTDDKRLNLYRFDPSNDSVERLTDKATWDIRRAAGHGDRVVYEAGGQLHELDLASGRTRHIEIRINPDLPQLRRRWTDVAATIQSARLSPTGKRAVITARGEVFTVPVDAGSTRNLTNTDGAREYTGLWSPGGDRVAWITEALDGQRLVIADQTGRGERQSFELGPDFYQLEAWDGDNGRIVFSDNRQGLHYIDIDTGRVTEIARSDRQGSFDLALSPDGQWLALTYYQANYLRDLKLYHFDEARLEQVTDGMADVASPVFSRDGKYLYLAASTNTGPRQFSLDMSSQERPYRAGLYALVLAADGASPLLPETGDETGSVDDQDDNNDEPAATRIDLDGLAGRMVALPVAKGNHGDLKVAADGALFYMHRAQPGATREQPGQSVARHHDLRRFDFEERTGKTVLSGLQGFDLSATGSHLLIQRDNGSLAVAEANEEIEPEELDLDDLKMRIDPRAEWAQIFDEGWRMQREYFYAENLHGLDWDGIYDQYRPLVDQVGRREDLNALMVEMIAELHAGHNRVGGGDTHDESGPEGGLLGANLAVHEGRWRIERIYTGESWNPFLRGPLATPGNQARAGEYILAIDGRELTADDNPFALLENTVDEQVALVVGPGADGQDSREILVEPVADETELRLWHWVETNRRTVDEATGGRVGYVYLPNTAAAGYTFFNRMFHAQLDRQALIIDERSNGGGQAADYIVEVLNRTHLSNWVYRRGLMSSTPAGALHGPKVMLIDQDAGSGGDYLPYAFRQLGIGTLIGTRTWGGLIGIYANPPLVDGGTMTVPHFRFVDADGNWSIENQGVAPDIEIELDPVATNAGRDSQLERAIEEIQVQLEDYSDDVPRQPPPLPTRLGR